MSIAHDDLPRARSKVDQDDEDSQLSTEEEIEMKKVIANEKTRKYGYCAS